MSDSSGANLFSNEAYEYQVGGSLGIHAPSYVERKADRDLYETLKAGQFCYVFNSRQMGKSSLRVRTMHRLRAEAIICIAIDLTRIGTEYIEPSQWYRRIIAEIWRGAQLDYPLSLKDWFEAYPDFDMVQLLDCFIEEVLLVALPTQQMVIFIDEVDSILGLNFQINDFFALIRACYNQRVDDPNYQRLSFCLLGVVTPSDLMRDKTRTPFNIAQQIALNGFGQDEIAPLVQGLVDRVAHPTAVVQEVVRWTGGQPFLTQKICRLVQMEPHEPQDKTEKTELAWVNQVIATHIINGWESQDEPEHLRTIQDRLLRDEQSASRLLGIYQEILTQDGVLADNSEGQTELLLSGLVVKHEQHLVPYNLIYRHVFNDDWVQRTLDDLRPYSVALNAWVLSDRQDDSRLLNGQTLEEALQWAKGRNLPSLDTDFLRESQTYDSWLARRAYRNLKQKSQRNIGTIRKLGCLLLSSMVVVGAYLHLQIWEQHLKLYERRLFIDPVSLERARFENKSGRLRVSGSSIENLIYELAMIDKLKSPTAWVLDRTLRIRLVTFFVPGLEDLWRYSGLDSYSSSSVVFLALAEDNLNVNFTASTTALPFLIESTQVSDTGGMVVAKGNTIRTPNEGLDQRGNRDGLQEIGAFTKQWTLRGQPASGETHTTRPACQSRKAISPNGEMTAIVSTRNNPDGFDRPTPLIRLLDSQGKLIKTIQPKSGLLNEIFVLCFSPDGQLLAAGGDSAVLLLSINGHLQQSFSRGPMLPTQSLSFSGDGKILIETTQVKSPYSDWNPDINGMQTIYFWKSEVTPSVNLNELKGVVSLVFSPDGKQLASLSQYDEKDSSYRGTYQLAENAVEPTKPFFGGKTKIQVWNRQNNSLNTLEFNNQYESRFTAIAFSPSGQYLAGATDYGEIALWSNLDWEMTAGGKVGMLGGLIVPDDPEPINHGTILSIKFSADSKTVVARTDGFIRQYDLNGQMVRNTQYKTFESDANHNYNEIVFGLSAMSPNGQFVAHTLDFPDGTPSLVDFKVFSMAVRGDFPRIFPDVAQASPAEKAFWKRFSGSPLPLLLNRDITDIEFSPDSQLIATAGRDNVVRLWSLDQGMPVVELFRGHWADVTVVTFSPDGQTIASGSADGTVRLWNLQGQPLADPLQGHRGEILALAFSPDGKTLASSSAENVRLWDLENLAPVSDLIPQYDETSLDWVDYTCDRMQGFLLGYKQGRLLNPFSEQDRVIGSARRACQRLAW